MRNAFSCVIHRNKRVFWKLGIDSHTLLRRKFNLDEKNINRATCAIEIIPNNDNYVFPDEWVLTFDDGMPDWWKESHERACWTAHKAWNKQLRKKLYINRLKNIIDPFKLPMVKKPTSEHIKLLKQWDSVMDSLEYSVRWPVRCSIGDSVGYSVLDFIGYSVECSVGDSVDYSVGYSMWAYIGWCFNLKRSEWKYTENIKTKGYPFMPAVKLWLGGIVPSFDGVNWRLHSGKNAKAIYKISREKLREVKG